MERFQAFAQFVDAGHGRRYGQAKVSVYLAGTITLAAIYADNSATPKVNPFFTDRSGYFSFYAANGRYDVSFTEAYPTIESPTVWPDIVLFDGGSSITVHTVSLAAQIIGAGQVLIQGGSLPGLLMTDLVWIGNYDHITIPVGLILIGVEAQAPGLVGFYFKNPTGGDLTSPAHDWKIVRFRP